MLWQEDIMTGTGQKQTGTGLSMVTSLSGGAGEARRPGEGPEGSVDDRNRRRLEALIVLFGISHADIARVAGVSRPLVSRVLRGDRGVNPATLYSRLEPRLQELVARRTTSYFELPAVDVGEAERAVLSATVTPLSRTT
jgi:AraC-like DNA-binding protein